MNNHHQNARTTFHSRALIVRRVLKEGMSAKEVGDQFGVSQRTVYKWLARFRAGGVVALHNRTSRPLRSPRRLPVERVATLAAMRRMGKTSPAIRLCPLPTSFFGGFGTQAAWFESAVSAGAQAAGDALRTREARRHDPH
jgi:transposase-like protein